MDFIRYGSRSTKTSLIHNIPQNNRIDQQNHAILMKKNDNDSNLYLSHDLLEKVMDARGGKNITYNTWREKHFN